jgi:hypothetical protein
MLIRAGTTTKKLECEPNNVPSSSVITRIMAITYEPPPSLPKPPEPKSEPNPPNSANHRNSISLLGLRPVSISLARRLIILSEPANPKKLRKEYIMES